MIDFYLTRGRFIAITLILLVMWAGVMLLFYLKLDEITKDPCSICAEKRGTAILCSVSGSNPVNIYYEPNGSVWDTGVDRPGKL